MQQNSIITMQGTFRTIVSKCFCEKNLPYPRHWAECYDDLKIKPTGIICPICSQSYGADKKYLQNRLESKIFQEKATDHRTWELGERGWGSGRKWDQN